jgi:hypothetical protein
MSLALRDPLGWPGQPKNLPVVCARQLGSHFGKSAPMINKLSWELGKERFFLQLSTSIQTCQSRGQPPGKKKSKMNNIIQSKLRSVKTLIVLGLTMGCFRLASISHAVNPPPDGCYPGFTTAEGCNALTFLTTGAGNTGIGWYSLSLDTTGNFNTGVGGGALALNNGDSNTAVGAAALLLNTTGAENAATGTDALVHNDTGSENTANGAFALFSNTTGSFNTAIGHAALSSNTTSNENTAVGRGALGSNSTGAGNTATGDDALLNNTTGGGNTANGRGALQLNTIGANNTANGLDALENNTTGSGNTAIGLGALASNASGNNNIGLGPDAGSNVTTANNVICIGNVAGVNVSNTCFIANIFGATASVGSAVFINSNGQLGTLTSSRRFKEEIKPIEEASEALFSLKPVSFRYKKEIDPGSTPQLGLVAEDVEKVNPHLVVRDQEGKAYTVRYDQVNAMLLNEFLKEHRAFVEEQRTVAQQQTEIDALKTELKEQRSLIQKVSDRVEMKKSTTQIVSKP